MADSFADAVKRQSKEIICYLYSKRQDLAIGTMALHCAYVASLRALKDTVSPINYKEFIDILRERDSLELDSGSGDIVDTKVGIA